MDLEDEVRELRARLDANDRLIETLLAWMFVNKPLAWRNNLFLGSLKALTATKGLPMNLTDEQAAAHADRMVMMQEALKTILGRIEPILRDAGPSGPPSSPAADEQ